MDIICSKSRTNNKTPDQHQSGPGHSERAGMRRVVLAAIGLLMLTAAHAASFDCAKANLEIEHLICDNPELSKLDDDLSKVYRHAVRLDADKRALIKAQQGWLKDVRNACADADCLARVYGHRIETLATVRAKPITGKINWGYRNGAGRNELLCQDLLSRLNKYDWGGSLDDRCSWDVIGSYPEFSRPPWQDLDSKLYVGLIAKLEKYEQDGPDGYFHRLAGLKNAQPDDVYAKWAGEFIKYGGRLQVWRTTLSPFDAYGSNSKGNSAAPRERTLVRLIGRFPTIPTGKTANPCGGLIKAVPHGTVFYVTPDLSGPDPTVEAGTFGLISGHDLMIYKGHPIFVGFQTILRDSRYGLISYCDFEFKGRE